MGERKTMKFNVFGDKVIFEPVKEEHTGTIELPQSRTRAFELGKVHSVGDGKFGDKSVPIYVKPGDVVTVQVNPMMAYNCQFKVNGQIFLVLPQQDILGILTKPEINEETFKIAGDWVLLSTFEDKKEGSVILTPENMDKRQLGVLRYEVAQIGHNVTNVKVGDEIVCERGRASLITIGRTQFFFIHRNNIAAVIEGAPRPEKEEKKPVETGRLIH